jgi:hypothetical protein
MWLLVDRMMRRSVLHRCHLRAARLLCRPLVSQALMCESLYHHLLQDVSQDPYFCGGLGGPLLCLRYSKHLKRVARPLRCRTHTPRPVVYVGEK